MRSPLNDTPLIHNHDAVRIAHGRKPVSNDKAVPKRAIYRELFLAPLMCVCSEDHPLAACRQLTVQQLKEAGRVAVCPPPVYPHILFTIQSQLASGQGPNRMLFCDNLEIVFSLAKAGFAFALTAQLPHTALPGLRYIPLSEFEPVSFGAAYLPGELNPPLRSFLSLLTEKLSHDI